MTGLETCGTRCARCRSVGEGGGGEQEFQVTRDAWLMKHEQKGAEAHVKTRPALCNCLFLSLADLCVACLG